MIDHRRYDKGAFMYTHATVANEEGTFDILFNDGVISEVLSLSDAECLIQHLNVGGCNLRMEEFLIMKKER
jgi:hypothetical protein